MRKRSSLFIAMIFFLSFYGNSLPGGAAAVSGTGVEFFEGVITQVIPAGADGGYPTLRIENYYGEQYAFQTLPQAYLTIDQLPARFQALRPGMEVYVALRSGFISQLEAFSTAASGYIEPESKMVQGRITDINRSEIQIRMASGKVESYYLTGATVVQRRGQFIPFDNVYVGDKAKLFFNQYASPEVSRIELEGASVVISGIYKGTLQAVDRVSSRMTVGGIAALGSGVWRGVDGTQNIDWAFDMPIYAGARKISQNQLQYYRGKTVYWVTQNTLGANRIARMVVQAGYESTFQDEIMSIGIAHDAIKLYNRKNISLHEGSIVIKDGRLQDVNALTTGMDVYVVGDGTLPSVAADIVYVLDSAVNNTALGQYNVYAGSIDMILANTLRLSHFFMLEDNEWSSYRDQKELYYDNDTKIFDVRLGQTVTMNDFINGSYYSNHYAYVYTMGDRCIGIWVDDRLRLPRSVSTGTVAAVVPTLTGNTDFTASLSEERMWLSDQWTFTYPTEKHFLESSMIIKDDRVVSHSALQSGDQLYMISNDNVPRIIIVK